MGEVVLSKSKAAKRAQYNDLRTRGYTHEQAEAEIVKTDEAIDIARVVGRPVSQPCGTEPAYKRALRRKRLGKDNCGPCDPCKEAWAEAQRRYYAKRKGIS